MADFNNKLIGEIKQQVELTNKYTATAKFDYFGSKGDAEVTLNLNVDFDGNAKDGYAAFKATGMGAEIISGCVEYTYENNTLTLKGMTVGDGNYGSTTADIILTVNDDGTLTGSGEYYGTSMMTATMKLILTDVQFIPEAEEGVKLADKYAATAKFDYFGSKGDAEVTLNLNVDFNGNAKDGYAAFKATGMGAEIISGCVEYTYENNTLTLKGMTVGDGNYGSTTADIIFTVNDDGTLTGSGEYYGTSMMTATMKLILTDVLFTELIE